MESSILVSATRLFVRIIIVCHPKVIAGFLPNVVWLRWVDAWVIARWGSEDVMISTSVRDLSSIWIPRSDKAVLVWSCGITKYLVRCCSIAAWLRKVVILHIYNDDMFELFALVEGFTSFAPLDPFTFVCHYRLHAYEVHSHKQNGKKRTLK